ncbi:unnamed protein product [Arabidopsis halleri]
MWSSPVYLGGCEPSVSSSNPSPLSHFVSRGFLYTMAVDQLSSEQTLLLVIDSELNSALQTDDRNLEEEMDLGSFPFRIEDDPGDQSVTMTRDYNEEHIKVSLGMPYLGADVIDAFGTRKDELSFPLVVTVTKKSGLSLEFTCEAYADYIDLADLTVNYPEDSLEYLMETDWPRFKNLDDNLKKAFQRYLATRVETSTAKLLHKYMMSKIKREYLEQNEEMAPGSFPFKIRDKPGDQSVTLTAYYNDEHIHIDVGMPYLGDDVIDVFGPRNDELSFPLVVTVTKKNAVRIEFTCNAYADYIDLTDLTLHDYPFPMGETDWPRFKNLDDNLKKAFHRYLATRLEASITKLLHKYMVGKTKREYLLWLKNVKKFVDG